MELSTNFLAPALYLAAAYLVQLRNRTDNEKISLFVVKSTWGGAMFSHFLAVMPLILVNGRWNLTFFNTASVTALLVALTLFFSCLKHKLEVLAVFILPVVACISLAAFALGEKTTTTNPDMNLGMQAHIIISLSAYGILILTAALAILLYAQNVQLRRGYTDTVHATLPSLECSEIFLFHLLSLGLGLLSLSLFSGWLYLEDLFMQHVVHKTVLSVLAWLILASLFIGHLTLGWRGRKFLNLLLSATTLLIIAYFGSKAVLEFILYRA